MSKAYNTLLKKHRQLQAMYKISRIASSTLEPPKLLRKLLKVAVDVTKASSGTIVLIDPNSGLLEIEVAIGIPRRRQNIKLKPGEGITGWTAAHGKSLRINDVTKDPRYIMVQSSVRSEMAIPLVVKDAVIGVLNVDSNRLDAFSDEHQKLLETIAQSTSKILHQAWIFKQGQDHAGQLEILLSIAQTIVSAINLDEVLALIARQATILLKKPLCSIMMLNETKDQLILKASHGAGQGYSRKPNLIIKESLIGVVIRRQQPLSILDVRESQRFQHLELAKNEGLVSLLSVPLIYRDQTIGAINVYTQRPHRFSNDEIRLLSALASFSAIAIEKARLYEKIVNVEEQLRQNERLSALGLLAAEIAHEIRNPLTVIKMLVHSVQEQFVHDPVRRKDCAMMVDKMNHMNAILDRVLTFARSSEPELSPIAVDLLFEDFQMLLRHKLNAQKVKLKISVAENLPPVSLDRAQIEQALLNLTLNALQAMPEGGKIKLTSKLLTIDQMPWLEICVADTGAGMPESVRARIFQPFLTTKVTGTGLGLAIVQKIVENHSGKISVISKVKRGTTFRILIPAF